MWFELDALVNARVLLFSLPLGGTEGGGWRRDAGGEETDDEGMEEEEPEEGSFRPLGYPTNQFNMKLCIAFVLLCVAAGTDNFPPTHNVTGAGWKYYCEGNCSVDVVRPQAAMLTPNSWLSARTCTGHAHHRRSGGYGVRTI